MLNLSFRQLFLAAALVCLAFLGLAYGLQFQLKLEPCPLCLLERYVFWCIAFVLILGSIHSVKSWGRFVYSGFLIFFGLLGISLTLRHLWLQQLPPEKVPACTAGLERLLAYQPFLQVLKTVLTASGECAKADFILLGLSLPAWAFLAFSGFTLLGVILIIFQKKRRI